MKGDTQRKRENRDNAIKILKEHYLETGKRVYVKVVRTSASGMSRYCEVFTTIKRGERYAVADITHSVALACEFPMDKNQISLIVRGTGFSAAQHVRDEIRHTLGFTVSD